MGTKDEKARRREMKRQGGGDRRSKTEKDEWKNTRRQNMRGQGSNGKVNRGDDARWWRPKKRVSRQGDGW